MGIRRSEPERTDPMALVLAHLGPLEARIMRAVWAGSITQPFSVRAAQELASHLAYTTMMTTLNRLADKGLLQVEHTQGQRAHVYRAGDEPREYLIRVSRRQAQRMLERYGDAALAAFAAELSDLSLGELDKLRRAADRD